MYVLCISYISKFDGYISSLSATSQVVTKGTSDQQDSSESDDNDKREEDEADNDKREGDEEKETEEPSFIMGGN